MEARFVVVQSSADQKTAQGGRRRAGRKRLLLFRVALSCLLGLYAGIYLDGIEPATASASDSGKISVMPTPARVLVLNSYHPRYVWADAVMRGISEVFQQQAPEAEVRYEYLDAKHYRPSLVFRPMRELLLAKYKRTGFRFDVIISTDDDALDFLVLYRDEIFPGTPVVFCGVNIFEPGRLKGESGFTGIVEAYDLKGTLDLVLKLHPEARHWALVSGMSTSSLMNQARFHQLYPQYMDRVNLIDLSRLNVHEMIDRLQRLPEDTIIIYLSWYKMPDGAFLSVRESTSLVLKYGNRPMYSPWDYTMGHGVIGGHVLKAAQHGSQAAFLALKILDGTPVSDIPITYHSSFTYLFDYGMLKRFGISTKALPAGYELINEPDTFYYRYKKQFWLVAGIFIYLLVTILALIRMIFQRKAVEANLRLNESRLEGLLELNQTGNIAFPGIIQMVLGKAVELTKSRIGILVFLGDGNPQGQACTLAGKDAMSFHLLDSDTLADLGRTAVFKELMTRRAPVLIDSTEELNLLARRCFSEESAPVRHFAVLPLVDGTTLQAVVGVGNKRSSYDGKDFRQLRLLLEGVLTLIRSRRAKEREERLEAQLQQAQKMEAIGTFAGGIAHDFNNILGGISSCSELALSELPEEDPAGEDLRQVLKAANRGKSLVRQILAFSRKKQEKIGPVDLCQVIAESMTLVRSLMPDTIEIQEAIPDREVVIMADPTQIQQVILNLCTNAEQAMRNQHGLLRISLEIVDIDSADADIHPELDRGQYAQILVTDTGEGIPAERLPRIFEPFYTTRSHMGGTGLGLSTSHGIVRRHCGAITVDSSPGQGAAFRVYLPLALSERPAAAFEREGSVLGGTERILLVDDDEIMRYGLTKYLRNLGYTVRAFDNGKEAYNAFRETGGNGFDLVVTDQSMPQMTGAALVQRIRKINDRVPVVLFSGFLGRDRFPSDLSGSGGLDVQYVLSKPFSNEQLGAAVRTALDQTAPPDS
jgi:two-component system cell cycle sensor histidine kinase/response regulator CckA